MKRAKNVLSIFWLHLERLQQRCGKFFAKASPTTTRSTTGTIKRKQKGLLVLSSTRLSRFKLHCIIITCKSLLPAACMQQPRPDSEAYFQKRALCSKEQKVQFSKIKLSSHDSSGLLSGQEPRNAFLSLKLWCIISDFCVGTHQAKALENSLQFLRKCSLF